MAVVCLPEYRWNCSVAVYIVWLESHFDRYAYNAAGPYRGWWQMSEGKFPDPETAFDPVLATQRAYQLWVESGGTFSTHWPTAGKGF